jgi:hypothetical protein
MDIQEVIEWTEERVFAKTGKHLDSLQKTILEGTLENRTYQQVADDYHCSKDHAKRVASELWKLLSDILGEDVKKANLKSILERIEFTNISNLGADMQILSNINICSDICPYPKTPKNQTTNNPTAAQPKKRHELTDVPKYNRLYLRDSELTTLKQWILQDNIPIVTIAGLSGIGKSALAVQLLEQIKDKFDRILWRSHTQFLTLASLQTNLIQFFSQTKTPKQPSLLDYLRSHSSLIVLDDLQETFIPQELAGTYHPDYQNYSKFLKQLASFPHNSNLLLLTQELPIELLAQDADNCRCRCLQLNGLADSAAEILQSRGLSDRDRWPELLHLYGTNPYWLNIIATTTIELFKGSVARLLSFPTVFLGDLEPVLATHYRRLSHSEKLTLSWLATQEDPIEIIGKPAELPFSEQDFLMAIRSLQRRCLLEKATDDTTGDFVIRPVVKEYAKNKT